MNSSCTNPNIFWVGYLVLFERKYLWKCDKSWGRRRSRKKESNTEKHLGGMLFFGTRESASLPRVWTPLMCTLAEAWRRSHLYRTQTYMKHADSLHLSPYRHERCVTQWCCQRNQILFPLHWRRSKSYHRRPLRCPQAGSLVWRQSRQTPGLQQRRTMSTNSTENVGNRFLWPPHTQQKSVVYIVYYCFSAED